MTASALHSRHNKEIKLKSEEWMVFEVFCGSVNRLNNSVTFDSIDFFHIKYLFLEFNWRRIPFVWDWGSDMCWQCFGMCWCWCWGWCQWVGSIRWSIYGISWRRNKISIPNKFVKTFWTVNYELNNSIGSDSYVLFDSK